jgi:hypothetical protein
MARLPVTPTSFKGHQGSPSTPIDYNSIELAVRGTLTNPPNSINDFDTLVALANWNLLDEQASNANGTPILRGQQPTSYGQFQGFPKVGINVVKIEGYLLQQQNNTYNSYLKVNLNSYGRRVGYNYRLKIISWTGESFTPPEPDLPGSGQTNYFETLITVDASTFLNTDLIINITGAQYSSASNTARNHIRIEFQQMMADGTYLYDTSTARTTTFYLFQEGTQRSTDIFGDMFYDLNPFVIVNPYPFAHTVYSTTAYDCEATTGASQVIYSDVTPLILNAIISQSTSSMVAVPQSFFHYFDGGIKYRVSTRINANTGNSFIFNIESCGSGSAPQQ